MSRLPLLAALCIAAPLAAQDSLVATAGLGFVNTAGNTDLTSLAVNEKVTYVTGPWSFTQRFAVVYARTGGVTSTSQWKAGLRVDRPVAAPLGMFALGGFERNRFAGLESRFEEAAGITARVLGSNGNTLDIEAGATLNHETPVGGTRFTFAGGRAAANYKRDLTEAAYFTVEAEFLPNFKTTDDYRLSGDVALVAPISNVIATKLTYSALYDHLPEPGFQTTDRIFTASIQFTF